MQTEDQKLAEMLNANARCGMIAVVGRANAGKSTLVNAILEEKVSIVSPIAQTTRNVIRGILTDERGQLVFLDTPGVHKPMSDLGKMMNSLARTSTEGVDVVLMVVDVSEEPRPEDEGWMRRLLFDEAAVVIALNKQDCNMRHEDAYRQMWAAVEREKETKKAVQWLETSALNGEGVAELVGHLFDQMPMGPLLFPSDVLTDFPRRLNMADIIREKFFRVLRDELPHAIAVGIDELEENEDGKWFVKASVYVNRPSQKGIVIGKKGKLLKSVQADARKEISSLYERPVDLELWVKVEKNWARNFFLLKRLGYRE